MNTRRLITFATLAALCVASAEVPAQENERRRAREREERPRPQAQPATQPAAAGYTERYAVLEQRNVFVRDRSRPTTRNTLSASTQPARRSAEQSLVVRGIAMEDIGYRAYVEDLNTGGTLRLSPGDALGPGHVAAVALDAIAYERDGKQSWIEIGRDLTGAFSAVATTTSASASSTTGPATLPANVDMNDPNLTVEQRMRLRVQLRQQQRGR